ERMPADIAAVSLPYRVIIPSQLRFDGQEAHDARDFLPGVSLAIAKQRAARAARSRPHQPAGQLRDFWPHRNLGRLLGLRRVDAPHHTAGCLFDVIGRESSELAEGPKTGVDCGEEKVPEDLVRCTVEGLLVLLRERKETRPSLRFLQALEGIGNVEIVL